MPENRHIPSHFESNSSSGLPVPNPTKPFWFSEPDEFLTGHRTTKDLPEYVDTVIIGCGLTGVSALKYMCWDDDKVGHSISGDILMLEAREACSGATGRNGGHLQPLLYSDEPSIASWEIKNCETVASFIKEHSIPCEYRSLSGCRGFFDPASNAASRVAYEELQARAPKIGEKVEWLATTEERREHGLQTSCLGGSVTQGAASMWPYKYVTWILRKLVEQKKVNLQTNTPVTKLINLAKQGDTVSTNATTRQYRYSLITPRGDIKARNVLLATNAYTAALVPSFADLIVPVRETMTALKPPRFLQTKLLPHSYGFVGLGEDPNPMATEYLIQRPVTAVPNPGGHLMLGGGRITAATQPTIGIIDDSVVDQSIIEYLRRVPPRALTLDVPNNTALELEAAWTGIWAASRDTAPWVGRVPYEPPGLWMCAAYTGHGMPNATLCAKAVVAMMKADLSGKEEDDFLEEMITRAEIPATYLITEDRVKAARKIPTMVDLDEMGIEGKEWLKLNNII
ncbi:DAO-domain-containing protein [Microthyrium microscopicum]|uniref:DAO-domain-containing protein n=1 Tax=Microthyrium microscopicum TaxID=703497 RepID=A0A6A6TU89_9PEZI|nr:DAO-domain-containing protein [Microthyrium microscopicum]